MIDIGGVTRIVWQDLNLDLPVAAPDVVGKCARRAKLQNRPGPPRGRVRVGPDCNVAARRPIEKLPRPSLRRRRRPSIIHLRLYPGYRTGCNAGGQSKQLIASVDSIQIRIKLDVFAPSTGGTGFVKKIDEGSYRLRTGVTSCGEGRGLYQRRGSLGQCQATQEHHNYQENKLAKHNGTHNAAFMIR